MNPPIKVSLALASACLLSLAPPTLAGVGMPPPGGGTDPFTDADLDASGGLSRTEFATTLDAGLSAKLINSAFKKADVDRSKEVTGLEFRYHLGEIARPTKEEISFEAADNDGNSFLDFGEFNLAVGHLRSRGVDLLRGFRLADESDDQRVTFDEWTLYKQGKAKGPEGASFLVFDLLDQFKDDEISYGEFTWFFSGETRQARVIARFIALDKDESGELTREEWNPGAKRQ